MEVIMIRDKMQWIRRDGGGESTPPEDPPQESPPQDPGPATPGG